MKIFSRPKPRSIYGWIPDLPDKRDFLFRLAVPQKRKLPPKTDLREAMSPVEDQGELGSCTAQAVVGCLEYLDKLDGEFTDWSRLFVYYNTRAIRFNQFWDSGGHLRDAIKTLASDGVCDERMVPYNIKKFTQKPCKKQYEEAKKHTIGGYARIGALNEMLSCLASGFPFVFGFTLYESFESSETVNTGMVRMPYPGEKELGGHAVCAVGYDMVTRLFTVRNSWGKDWGMDGYFLMPFDYLSNPNLADDFWYITKGSF